MKNRDKTKILSLIVAAFLALGMLLFISYRGESLLPSAKNATQPAVSQTIENPFIPNMQEIIVSQSFNLSEIVVRLLIAVVLAAVLAFRPRKNVRLFERNLYVAQTQILLAVVAAALMMIVGDNTARAFAIFAAVSLVRFRTNIRDPKEVTVLLICLALGLSAGVGRWDLGLVLCIFVLILLQLLEYKEPSQAVRPMELTVKTRNSDSTQLALKKIFQDYNLESEVRQIDSPDEANPIGALVYYLNLRLNLSTDYLSEKIFALDSGNIDGIQWTQKKSATDIYQ